MKVKEYEMDIERAIEVFGDFRKKFVIATDEEELKIGDEVTLVNEDCPIEFDNVKCAFANNLLYYFIVDLQLISVDYRSKYKYAKFKVLKIHEKTY